MTDVTLYTGAGHRQAPDIVDALLSSPATALERARAVIEAERPGADEVATCRLLPDARCGQSITLYDHLAGKRRGRIVSVRFVHARGAVDTTQIGVRL
jgi:hypothetical protein